MLLFDHVQLQRDNPMKRALPWQHLGGCGFGRCELGAGSGRCVCGEVSQPYPFLLNFFFNDFLTTHGMAKFLRAKDTREDPKRAFYRAASDRFSITFQGQLHSLAGIGTNNRQPDGAGSNPVMGARSGNPRGCD